MFNKGQMFETSYNHEVYTYVGNWSDCLVLAPENEKSEEVLIYSLDEVKALIEEGRIRMVTDFFFQMT